MELWKLWTLRRPGGAPVGATLASELIARAAAIGAGKPRSTATPLLPRDLRAALRASEVRARRLAEGWGQGAALDFLGDAIVAIAVEHRLEPGEARVAVTTAADELGLPPEAAAFAVFRRALASKEFAQLPPAVAAELALALLVELAPAAAGSLWILDAAGSTTCLVSHGKAPRSRRLREVAQRRARRSHRRLGPGARAGRRAVGPPVRRARGAWTSRRVGASRGVPRGDRDRAGTASRAGIPLRPESAARARPRGCRRAAHHASRLRPARWAAAGDRRAGRGAAHCVDADLGGRSRRLQAARARSLQRRPRAARRPRREPARDRALHPLDDGRRPPRRGCSRGRAARARERDRHRGRSPGGGQPVQSQRFAEDRALPRRPGGTVERAEAQRGREGLGRAAQQAHLRRSHGDGRRVRLPSASSSTPIGSASPGSPSECGYSVERSRSRRVRARGQRSARPCLSGGRRHPRPLRSTPQPRESPGPHRLNPSCRGRVFRCGRPPDPGARRWYRHDDHRYDQHHGRHDDHPEAPVRAEGRVRLPGGRGDGRPLRAPSARHRTRTPR